MKNITFQDVKPWSLVEVQARVLEEHTASIFNFQE
jgi:hypothetical protein